MKKFAFALICTLAIMALMWSAANDGNGSSEPDDTNSADARPNSVPSFIEPGDTTIVGDFDGDGLADDSCWYDPATGKWKIRNYQNQSDTGLTWWSSLSESISRCRIVDYNEDGLADIAYFDEKSGHWLVAVNGPNQFADPVVVDSTDLF